jgi:hypothetical protein
MFMTGIWCSSFQELCGVFKRESFFARVKVKLSKVVLVRAMKAYEGVKV